jgi:hypothetical protein
MPFTISGIISALAWSQDLKAGCKWSLLAKPDRLAIGSILRSKLVFLVNVRLREETSVVRGFGLKSGAACILPSVWTLIMRAIKCLKGVRWMPWR